jgi:hypothetical protein
MDVEFVDDVVDISGLVFRFSLYFSLLLGNSIEETGSIATASATTQSLATGDFPAGSK